MSPERHHGKVRGFIGWLPLTILGAAAAVGGYFVGRIFERLGPN
jgi:hypothetical protein